MLISAKKDEDTAIKHGVMILMFIIGAVWFIWTYLFHYDYFEAFGFWWLPIIIIIPAFLDWMTLCFVYIGKYLKYPMIFLRACGRSSLEILLFSNCVFDTSKYRGGVPVNDHLIPFLEILVSIIIGIALHYFIEYLMNIAASRLKSNN